jgi:glyoxylase-like metal-dependent hydrolase (beta-lactamase superfamily II)
MKLEPADRVRQITPTLYTWVAYQPDWQIHFNSYALADRDGLVLVDPTRPAADALKQLEQLGPPVAILLTNANHERDAHWFRKTYEIQIYASEKAAPDCDIKIDVPLLDGERVPGGLRAVYLPGAAPGEMAFHGAGLLMIGDSLLHKPGGLELLPEQYVEDPKAYRQSLRRLLQLSYDMVSFAHGEPILRAGKSAIRRFLTPRRRGRSSTGKAR